MRTNTVITLVAILLTTLISCGGSIDSLPATADGFSGIESEIKSKFGDDAYFTDISILYNEGIGNMLNITVTEAPESLTMGEWNNAQGVWNQNAEVSLELPPNTKAVDFMYQLDEEINLSTLGGLVEKSKAQLEEEKDLKNAVLSIAHIKFPDNGDINEAEYVVQLEPENGGTTFSFYYKLNGDLIDMSY